MKKLKETISQECQAEFLEESKLFTIQKLRETRDEVSFEIQNWDNFVSQIGDRRWCGGGSDRRLDISNPRL